MITKTCRSQLSSRRVILCGPIWNRARDNGPSYYHLFLKVTKLDRDPSSGTALQEISFWLSLERALLRIQEKRENQEIQLTLDILKAGKRFHATVSFDNDTGMLLNCTLIFIHLWDFLNIDFHCFVHVDVQICAIDCYNSTTYSFNVDRFASLQFPVALNLNLELFSLTDVALTWTWVDFLWYWSIMNNKKSNEMISL